jgi:threonine synthase
MSVESLKCKECGTGYELDASYFCENCFGPL